jgi:hypothetical protein
MPSLYRLSWFILLPYLILAIGSSVQLSMRHGWKFCFVLPGLFFLHHFMYGLATTVGLLTWHSLETVAPPLQQGVGD